MYDEGVGWYHNGVTPVLAGSVVHHIMLLHLWYWVHVFGWRDGGRYMIMPCYGNAFTLLTLCEGTPQGCSGFPSQRAWYAVLWYFLCCESRQAVEQTVKLLVTPDAMTVMWCHCNVVPVPVPVPVCQCRCWCRCQCQCGGSVVAAIVVVGGGGYQSVSGILIHRGLRTGLIFIFDIWYLTFELPHKAWLKVYLIRLPVCSPPYNFCLMETSHCHWQELASTLTRSRPCHRWLRSWLTFILLGPGTANDPVTPDSARLGKDLASLPLWSQSGPLNTVRVLALRWNPMVDLSALMPLCSEKNTGIHFTQCYELIIQIL